MCSSLSLCILDLCLLLQHISQVLFFTIRLNYYYWQWCSTGRSIWSFRRQHNSSSHASRLVQELLSGRDGNTLLSQRSRCHGLWLLTFFKVFYFLIISLLFVYCLTL